MTLPMSFSEPPHRDRGCRLLQRWGAQLVGAITFYTGIPIPHHWPMRFDGIAKYAPLVGLMIGGVIIAADSLFTWIGLPPLTRCTVLVALWLLITAGLHLDGAMDAADGLAVPDPDRRLEVMADSRTGAFGVMVAVVLLGLKVSCLADLEGMRGFALLTIMGWGRWGQVVAIARYPYLRAAGKGAFHQAHAHPTTDWLLGFSALVLLAIATWAVAPDQGWLLLSTTIGGCAIALLTGAWFNWQFGGHTGDTYGAIVEWTEALMLLLLVALQGLA